MMKLYDIDGNYIMTIHKEDEEIPEVPSVHTTRNKLGRIFYDASKESLDDFYHIFRENAKDFNIITQTQENFFFAQIIAEVGYDLISRRENLNYSCDVLVSIFNRYNNNPSWAQRDGRCNGHKADQEMIGNVAYSNRIGNGNIASGDGYAFRGGGFFQLTGRYNYDKMSEVIQQITGMALGSDSIAFTIETVETGLLTAMAFWIENKCYECKHIDCVTAKINLHTDSYEKRKQIYQWIAEL